MSCARCGTGIYKTEEFISLNKVWHKGCFTCYQCNKRLDKESTKIFQGELFCEVCYATVIERLFEVISQPSFIKPCRVVSTPSCAVSKTFIHKFQDCDPCARQLGNCANREYCFPAEKKHCIQRSTLSCSCIPNQSNNEYCFSFPIPREVANYYNRSHMKSKTCKNPISCGPQSQCPVCSCRKTCYSEPKCPGRSPKNQCCCNSCVPRCGTTTIKKCCCSKPPSPCTPVFTKVCGCCLPQEPECCDPCPPPQSCGSPCQSSAPCQPCSCCSRRHCKKKCLPDPCPPANNCCETKCCSSPPNCSKPAKCCAPPSCPPVKWCPPQKCCPRKVEGCCEQQCLGVSRYCCKTSNKCCYRNQKYCICGNMNPCNCKMSQIRDLCTICCNRCGQKVYAAEKVQVTSGAYHTSCFTCYCCNKCLDLKNVFEGCGEIYCKQCYNHFFGIQYYGFGRVNC